MEGNRGMREACPPATNYRRDYLKKVGMGVLPSIQSTNCCQARRAQTYPEVSCTPRGVRARPQQNSRRLCRLKESVPIWISRQPVFPDMGLCSWVLLHNDKLLSVMGIWMFGSRGTHEPGSLTAKWLCRFQPHKR